jgi:hypothetical protein
MRIKLFNLHLCLPMQVHTYTSDLNVSSSSQLLSTLHSSICCHSLFFRCTLPILIHTYICSQLLMYF